MFLSSFKWVTGPVPLTTLGPDILSRWDVTPTGATPELAFQNPNFDYILGLAFSPSGDLFIGNRSSTSYLGGGVMRFRNVLSTPTYLDSIAPRPPHTGFYTPTFMTFRGSELLLSEATAPWVSRWLTDPSSSVVPNPTEPVFANIRTPVITNQIYSVKMSPWGEAFVSTNSGLLNYPNPIYRYTFDANGNTVPNGTLTFPGNAGTPEMRGIMNMAFSPWGELFVISTEQYNNQELYSRIYRFTFDASRNAIFNGTIEPSALNGMNNPTAGAFSSWGELFVVNYFAPVVSRFKFDANRNVSEQGKIDLPYAALDIAFAPNTGDTTATISLTTALGAGLPGGNVSYLDQSNVWQPVGTTGPSGSVQTSLPAGTWRFRMTYNGQSLEKVQNIATPIVFTTTAVKLQFSDSIEFQDHSGLWRSYTKPSMEMLPVGNALFRFGAGGSTILAITGTEVRKSIAAERLIDSFGAPLAGATGQYYLGAWRPCVGSSDSTGYLLCVLDGLVSSTTFGLEYAFTQQQKAQNIAADSYVNFQTRRVRLQLKNSGNLPLDTGTALYYAGAWRSFGSTTGGETAKELMPGSYTFSMNYAFTTEQKSQDIAANPIVVFQTRAVAVQLKNSSGAPLDTGTAQYYAGAWRSIGNTSAGQVTVELMAGTYSFGMSYASTTEQKAQNIAADPTVVFQTRAVVVQLKNSSGAPLDTGTAQYYSGAWRNIGNTSAGQVTVELMAGTYSFSMSYASTTEQKSQNISANPVVVFQTRAVVLRLLNSSGAPLDTGAAQYYSGAWRTVGNTSGGQVATELMAGTYSFSMSYAFTQQQKTQNIAADPVVIFQTGRVSSASNSCTGYYAGGWRTFVNNMDLLPGTYTFQFNDGTAQTNSSVIAGATTGIH